MVRRTPQTTRISTTSHTTTLSRTQPEIQTRDNGLLEACVDAPVAAVPGSGRGVGKAGYALGADRAECARIGAAGRDVAAIDIGIRFTRADFETVIALFRACRHGHRFGHAQLERLGEVEELGRASCRERVC